MILEKTTVTLRLGYADHNGDYGEFSLILDNSYSFEQLRDRLEILKSYGLKVQLIKSEIDEYEI